MADAATDASTTDASATDASATDAKATDASATDAGGPDANEPDAATVTAFDVAYGNVFLGNGLEHTLGGFLRVANTGTTALDLATLEIVDAADDCPGLVVAILGAGEASTAILSPGQVSGGLVDELRILVVDDGLMPGIPVAELSYGALYVRRPDFASLNCVVTATLRLGGKSAQLAITLQGTTGDSKWAGARKVSAE